MAALEKSCFITKLDILPPEQSRDAYRKEKDEMAWVSIYVSMSTPVSFPNMCVVLRDQNPPITLEPNLILRIKLQP